MVLPMVKWCNAFGAIKGVAWKGLHVSIISPSSQSWRTVTSEAPRSELLHMEEY